MLLPKDTECIIFLTSHFCHVITLLTSCEFSIPQFVDSFGYSHGAFFGDMLTELWFLQSSRLHFIGTWRSRYRKRFPSSSSEFKCRSSDLNTSDNSNKSTIIHVDMVLFFNILLLVSSFLVN